jgi:hypothetical protein
MHNAPNPVPPLLFEAHASIGETLVLRKGQRFYGEGDPSTFHVIPTQAGLGTVQCYNTCYSGPGINATQWEGLTSEQAGVWCGQWPRCGPVAVYPKHRATVVLSREGQEPQRDAAQLPSVNRLRLPTCHLGMVIHQSANSSQLELLSTSSGAVLSMLERYFESS